MKKIKLNSEEKKSIKELAELNDKSMKVNLEAKSLLANFWKVFNAKHGFGNYKIELKPREVYSLSSEEITKMKPKDE